MELTSLYESMSGEDFSVDYVPAGSSFGARGRMEVAGRTHRFKFTFEMGYFWMVIDGINVSLTQSDTDESWSVRISEVRHTGGGWHDAADDPLGILGIEIIRRARAVSLDREAPIEPTMVLVKGSSEQPIKFSGFNDVVVHVVNGEVVEKREIGPDDRWPDWAS